MRGTHGSGNRAVMNGLPSVCLRLVWRIRNANHALWAATVGNGEAKFLARGVHVHRGPQGS